ncbi:MAG: alpha/beta hydrolase-fold protein [Actinomycetota bacterium]
MAWRTSEHLLHDPDHTGSLHFVSIDLPLRFEKLDRPPLIVCLDGAWLAGTVRDATRLMSMSGEAPEAIVVGVWFDEPVLKNYLRDRARWYTPTGWVPPPQTGIRDVAAEELGHAETYRAFIRNRLLPFVAEEAPFGETWLVGHSFSALFGLHCLLEQPAMFDRYLLASPSIWWDDRAIFDFEERYADMHGDLPAQVFLSAGEQELGEGDDEFRMRANMVEMGERLRRRGYPNLDLTWTVLAGESHNSTTSNAINKGIRSLHRRRPEPFDAVDRAPKDQTEHDPEVGGEESW